MVGPSFVEASIITNIPHMEKIKVGEFFTHIEKLTLLAFIRNDP
jgi:hypothetical protein